MITPLSPRPLPPGLNVQQLSHLRACESLIRISLVNVGYTLKLIRDNQLFLCDGPAFATYLEKWDLTPAEAETMIRDAEELSRLTEAAP